MFESAVANDLLTHIRMLRCSRLQGHNEFICSNCERSFAKVFRCARCHIVSYCSKECQRASWKSHKATCEKFREALKQEAAGEKEQPKLDFKTASWEERQAMAKRCDGLLLRALVLTKKHKMPEAIALLDQVLDFIPGYTEAADNKGLLLCMSGQLDAGIRIMEEGREFDRQCQVMFGKPAPTRADLCGLYNLGKAYMERAAPGDLERAIDALRENMAREPKHSATRQMLGNCLLQTGDKEGAVKMHEEALELAGPDDTASCFTVAQHCIASGDLERARNLLRRCGKDDLVAQMLLLSLGNGPAGDRSGGQPRGSRSTVNDLD